MLLSPIFSLGKGREGKGREGDGGLEFRLFPPIPMYYIHGRYVEIYIVRG